MYPVRNKSCQTAIVQDLRAAGTDYVLAVKRNQPQLHTEVATAFADAEQGTFTPETPDRYEIVERNGGRTAQHRLVRVRTQRNGPLGRRQRAVRCCIANLPVDAAALLALIRGHWRGLSGRENDLHRILDVQFREDDGRLRRGHAPAVMGPQASRPEQSAHGSTEFQIGFVHRVAAGQDRTQPGPAGSHSGLTATFRLPWLGSS